MKKVPHFSFWPRVLCSGLVGLVMAGFLFNYAWDASTSYLRLQQRMTEKKIRYTKNEINAYRLKKGTYPRLLADMSASSETTEVDPDWFVRDSWRRPMVYSVLGDGYSLVSLGRDGKPGGVGLDLDLDGSNAPLEAKLPLRQFAEHPKAQGVVWATLFLFVMTAAVVFRGLGRMEPGAHRRDKQAVEALVVRLLMTLVATVFIGLVIMNAHIPSGH